MVLGSRSVESFFISKAFSVLVLVSRVYREEDEVPDEDIGVLLSKYTPH